MLTSFPESQCIQVWGAIVRNNGFEYSQIDFKVHAGGHIQQIIINPDNFTAEYYENILVNQNIK